MGSGKLLLLLPALGLLVRCQTIPEVFMSPRLSQIFVGDLFYMSCAGSSNEDAVKWYLNDTVLNWTSTTVRIAAAAPSDSGLYSCERDGKKSEDFNIAVIEYLPIASLIMETGQPVMRFGDSVILKIENEDGLKEWVCWVFRGNSTKKIVLRVKENDVSLSFQPNKLCVPETVFWCTHKSKIHRSNQVVVRTSDKIGALEMYPLPAVAGGRLTLRCLVWGTDMVSNAVFYKDNTLFVSVQGSMYDIDNVEKSKMGNYKCNASYKYRDQTVKTQHRLVSDTQEVPVQVSPVRAVLSENMLCSCPSCASGMTYRYYRKTGESWNALGSNPNMKNSGTYHCRAVLDDMKTLPSISLYHDPKPTMLWIWIILVIVGLCTLAVAFYLYKKKNTTGQIYEDVPLRLQGDDKYDTLHPREREAEYDTLSPGASGGQERGGEYEALNTKEMKEGPYDVLEATGAEGGDGDYEVLKKVSGDGGEYQTLGTKSVLKKDGTDGGEYQALDKAALKEGADEGEYQTLETKSVLKKDGTDRGEYQALDKAALKEGADEGEYQTLETKGEVGKPEKDK